MKVSIVTGANPATGHAATLRLEAETLREAANLVGTWRGWHAQTHREAFELFADGILDTITLLVHLDERSDDRAELDEPTREAIDGTP